MISIQENALKHVICKMAAILSWPQRVAGLQDKHLAKIMSIAHYYRHASSISHTFIYASFN